jgi:hypothetical protein
MKILTQVNGGKAADRPQKINFLYQQKSSVITNRAF